MKPYYYDLANLPTLPVEFHTVPTLDQYTWMPQKDLWLAACAFESGEFFINFQREFPQIRCHWIMMPPHTVFDWHCDQGRSASINWLVSDPALSMSAFKGTESSLQKSLHPVPYQQYRPIVFNTQYPHAVFNYSHSARHTVTISILKPTSFDSVLQYLMSL